TSPAVPVVATVVVAAVAAAATAAVAAAETAGKLPTDGPAQAGPFAFRGAPPWPRSTSGSRSASARMRASSGRTNACCGGASAPPAIPPLDWRDAIRRLLQARRRESSRTVHPAGQQPRATALRTETGRPALAALSATFRTARGVRLRRRHRLAAVTAVVQPLSRRAQPVPLPLSLPQLRRGIRSHRSNRES